LYLSLEGRFARGDFQSDYSIKMLDDN